MPKIITYPKASQSKSLTLAKAVNSLGGTCSQELAAEKIGMKPGGGFNVILSGGVKYGFLTNKRGELSVTSLLRELCHAYTEEETKEFLKQSLLSVPLYKDLVNRFPGNHLPVEILDKLLIREMGVDAFWASKVAKYFIADARNCGLLSENNQIIIENDKLKEPQHSDETESNDLDATGCDKEESSAIPPPASILKDQIHDSNEFIVSIKGPGMNTTITITDEDDMLIVETTLNKIKKQMATM